MARKWFSLWVVTRNRQRAGFFRVSGRVPGLANQRAQFMCPRTPTNQNDKSCFGFSGSVFSSNKIFRSSKLTVFSHLNMEHIEQWTGKRLQKCSGFRILKSRFRAGSRVSFWNFQKTNFLSDPSFEFFELPPVQNMPTSWLKIVTRIFVFFLFWLFKAG